MESDQELDSSPDPVPDLDQGSGFGFGSATLIYFLTVGLFIVFYFIIRFSLPVVVLSKVLISTGWLPGMWCFRFQYARAGGFGVLETPGAGHRHAVD